MNEVNSKREFGEVMRELRIKKRFSLRQFAKILGKSPTYISMIECGKYLPTSEEFILAVAKELDSNKDEFLAMAGKVSSELIDIIVENPVTIAKLLRTASYVEAEEISMVMKG